MVGEPVTRRPAATTEREDVGELVSLLRERLAGAVAGSILLPQQDRMLVAARGRPLHDGGHLACVVRIDASVALGRGEEHRGVAGAGHDVVIRGVREHPLELLGDVRIAVLGGPELADEVEVVAHHVEQRNRAMDRPREIGPLRHRRAHEQPAVRASSEREAASRGEPVRHEPIARRVEVVEHLLLVLAHAGSMPVLAFLGAAADAGVGENAARLCDRDRNGGVGGRRGDREAPVPGEHAGRVSGRREVTPADEEHRHVDAVGRRVPDLLDMELGGVDRG